MERRGSDKRLYFGVILIVLGVILILERLNLIPESLADMLISWQMLLVGFGVLSLIGGNRTAGTILIIIGATFMIPELITVPHELRRIYWPLILVAIGVSILLRRRDHLKIESVNVNEPAPEINDNHSVHTFDDFVIFGGREIFVNSQALAGGKATSIFGGIEFDLRKASLKPGGAVIDCVSVFGGCGFKIPMDWNVRNEVTTIFGAFTDKRGDTYSDKYYDPSKTIVIKGVSIFGGIEVKHF
ncbi:MAG: cell wall-active antibiotics response protein [Prolixibacteraceae bacterium]|jgi:predicted membrane protein|nr:cell wall-active antibiotics response protein [Prolixibacteraceae bacterium]